MPTTFKNFCHPFVPDFLKTAKYAAKAKDAKTLEICISAIFWVDVGYPQYCIADVDLTIIFAVIGCFSICSGN